MPIAAFPPHPPPPFWAEATAWAAAQTVCQASLLHDRFPTMLDVDVVQLAGAKFKKIVRLAVPAATLFLGRPAAPELPPCADCLDVDSAEAFSGRHAGGRLLRQEFPLKFLFTIVHVLVPGLCCGLHVCKVIAPRVAPKAPRSRASAATRPGGALAAAPGAHEPGPPIGWKWWQAAPRAAGVALPTAAGGPAAAAPEQRGPHVQSNRWAAAVWAMPGAAVGGVGVLVLDCLLMNAGSGQILLRGDV